MNVSPRTNQPGPHQAGAEVNTALHRERALLALRELPPFSPVLNRLMAALAQEEVSFSRLGDLIEKDTVVAGNVLQLVNSALYGRQGTINSVRHAVSLLGINKLRNAVLGMSITRLWNRLRTPPGWSMARFNLHSVAVAILADMAAQNAAVEYPEGAFIAGLFHDLGKVLIAIGCRNEYSAILGLQHAHGLSAYAAELEILGISHPQLSAQAVTAWNLPAPIQQAVLFHHSPQEDPSSAKGDQIPLSRLIEAVDGYMNAIGISLVMRSHAAPAVPASPAPEPPSPELEESLARLRQIIPQGQLERTLAEFHQEFASIALFFG